MPIKMRSPRYPVISLADAIEKARAVYAADHRNKIRKDLVAEHMGYHSLNGASLGVISAVTKYGLLEGGLESMNITSRAVDIFEHEMGHPLRVAALRDAAQAPELFKEVSGAFPGKASDAAIRSHLITKLSFLPDAATKFVKSYRETMQLVDQESAGYDSGELPEPGPMQMSSEPVTPESKLAHMQGQITADRLARSASVALGEDERELTTGILSKGASFRLIVSGKVGEREIERLIKKLELDKEILADADIAEVKAAEEDDDDADLAVKGRGIFG